MKKIIFAAICAISVFYIHKTGIIGKMITKKPPNHNKKDYANIESRKYCDINYRKENSNVESGS